EDLDVLIELCDRIMVICGGKISGIVEGRGAKKEELGLLMTKVDRNEATPNAEENREEGSADA
ncbi:MAG: ABC transporter ATP-binding protein, partial [Clostridia bacterium]|nr:ABC transporter ATP-binding protein [Clostridia bacterium]